MDDTTTAADNPDAASVTQSTSEAMDNPRSEQWRGHMQKLTAQSHKTMMVSDY